MDKLIDFRVPTRDTMAMSGHGYLMLVDRVVQEALASLVVDSRATLVEWEASKEVLVSQAALLGLLVDPEHPPITASMASKVVLLVLLVEMASITTTSSTSQDKVSNNHNSRISKINHGNKLVNETGPRQIEQSKKIKGRVKATLPLGASQDYYRMAEKQKSTSLIAQIEEIW